MPIDTPASSWSEAKRARVEAAQRHRRIIYNDDGHELDREEAQTPEGFLRPRLLPLLGTHVDTIALNLLKADSPMYDSRVQPIYGDAHPEPLTHSPLIGESVKALTRGGRCPLRIVVDFAHDNGMETFASFRMNDVHDSFVPGWRTEWKVDHPELMVETIGMLPQFELYTSSQDFSHEAVRRRKLEVIEDVCGRYDIDGIELDFIRHPVLFSRTMRGEAVTDDEAMIITDMMRKVRQIGDDTAATRGRPLLVSARIPDRLDQCRHIGLEMPAWLEQDLVDMIIAGGGYTPFALPLEEVITLARPHGVPVYPCMKLGPLQHVCAGELLAAARGLAANWYASGADGIQLFNFFRHPPEHMTEERTATDEAMAALFNEVGDPQVLVGKDKLFCVDKAGLSVFDYYSFIAGEPPLPVTSKRGLIKGGVMHRIPLLVGDDVEAAGASGRLGQMELAIDLCGPLAEEGLAFRVNGHLLTDGECRAPDAEEAECTMRYAVGVPPLRAGRNLVEWSMDDPVGPVELRGMRLKVTYT